MLVVCVASEGAFCLARASQLPALNIQLTLFSETNEAQMRVGRPGNRSSLLSHTFPSFYACYLLKSVQTPKSNATYIGSTPNPPRRIRQHNGELTQGAWKTSRGRPWVMQMIVHGFPSKLAALQFEWAWQHPHLSRHIRDGNGKVFTTSGRSLKQNIQILRFMISIHPYNLWPLHVKVFTPQALKIWQEFSNVKKATKGKGKQKADAVGSITLPRGFTHSVELEGVDGKLAGGSGRTEPIDVQDEKFTSAHLNKHINLLASKESLECSVCHEPLTTYTSDPLTHALCPQHACNGTAHLLCLSQHFLNQGPSDPMVPRGGDCPSCSTFVLWGDVVKGCYRRAAGGAVSVEEEEEALDKMYNSDSLAEDFAGTSEANRKAKGVISPRKKRERRSRKESSTSSQGEEFDFDVVERERYSDEPGIGTSPRRIAGSPSKLKTGRVHLTLPTPVTPSASARPRKPKTKTSSSTRKPVRRAKKAQESSEGELFDFDGVERMSFSDDEAPKSKRKVGRPKVLSAVPGPSSRLTGVVKRGRPRKDSSSAGLSSNPSRSPTKKLSSTSKRTFITGRPLSELAAPLESSRSGVLPLFESDDEDAAAKILGDDVLLGRMSSLSVSSPSSSL
ncbi:hypothetical protein F5890DRAFT_265375 [Lentinula detonsa]|uniref:GIY-YIG domain-containing protein n=1 Tax=Lentinula detonsa TaxID=2804962 RepID=A0AA38Q7A2_9AGAR|nr:hypothetical protein F5890DRAFT_265375 [Lentinula detonsa]